MQKIKVKNLKNIKYKKKLYSSPLYFLQYTYIFYIIYYI